MYKAPTGFTHDGDAVLPQAAQCHGEQARSQLHTCGCITPKFADESLVHLSPFTGRRTLFVPNGLPVLSKAMVAAWAQVVEAGPRSLLSLLLCVASQCQVPGTPAAEDNPGSEVLMSVDPAERTKRLVAVLATGRRALMAVIGMIIQEGLAGSEWGDLAPYAKLS